MSARDSKEDVHDYVLHRLWDSDSKAERLGSRAHWPGKLRRLTGWPESKCKSFLEQGEMSDVDVGELVERLSVEEEVLRAGVQLPEGEVFRLNLEALLATHEYGSKGKLAEAVGVSRNAVSNWVKGKHPPTRPNLRGIAVFFGLPPGTDLWRQPLFVSYRPTTLRGRRARLIELLKELPDDRLQELLPAFETMLEPK